MVVYIVIRYNHRITSRWIEHFLFPYETVAVHPLLNTAQMLDHRQKWSGWLRVLRPVAVVGRAW